jgi:hypothetical protein
MAQESGAVLDVLPGAGLARDVINDTIWMSVGENAIYDYFIAGKGVDSTCLDDNSVVERTIADGSIRPVHLSKSGASTNDVLKFNGTNWILTPGVGDIEAVNPGSGLTGGGESGEVTLSIGTGTVTVDHLGTNSVDGDAIMPGAVVNADINTFAAIDPAKISGTAATLANPNTFAATNTFSGDMICTNIDLANVTGPSNGHCLEVTSTGNGTDNATTHIENLSSNGIGLWVEAWSTDLPVLISQHGTGDILRCDCWTGGWHEVFKVRNDGVTEVDELKIMGGADFAEPFPVSNDDHIPPGALMVIDDRNPGHLKMSEAAYDTRVAGVISGAGGVEPGLTLQQRGVFEDGQLVALNGRVYALADASYGAVEAGDLLTTSPTPGHAMKAKDRDRAHGAVIGKAMTELKSGTGLILVLVNLQ